MQPAPLRSLNDFLIVFARFQFPDFSDTQKWGHRVKFNLIYYQSNYFLSWISIFLMIGLFHPVKMILGLISAAGMVFLYVMYVTSSLGPASALLGISISLYFIDSIVIFVFGIVFSLSATFIHATLRLRDLDNKLTIWANTGYETVTPMELFFEKLDSLLVSKGYSFMKVDQRKQSGVKYKDVDVVYEADPQNQNVRILESNNIQQPPVPLRARAREHTTGTGTGTLTTTPEDAQVISSATNSPRNPNSSQGNVNDYSNSRMDKNIQMVIAKTAEGLDKASEKLGVLSNHLRKLRKK